MSYSIIQLDANVDSSLTSAIAAGAIVDPITLIPVTTINTAVAALLSAALNPVITNYLNSFAASRKATFDAANANYKVAIFPTIAVMVAFDLQSPTLTIAHGSTGNLVITVLFVDPTYSGTVTIGTPVLSPTNAGITFGAFSPTTRSTPGTTTSVVTVGGGVTPGNFTINIPVTDGTITNTLQVALTVT